MNDPLQHVQISLVTVARAKDQVATTIKYALDDANIEIPYPQQTMHIASVPPVFGEPIETDPKHDAASVSN